MSNDSNRVLWKLKSKPNEGFAVDIHPGWGNIGRAIQCFPAGASTRGSWPKANPARCPRKEEAMGAARCSFGRIAYNEAIDAQYPFGTDLEGRFLYVRDGEQQWLLAVFDASSFWRRTCWDWRRRISEATGIPALNIWVHDTHDHTAPSKAGLEGEPFRKVASLSIPVIRNMVDAAEEAEVSHATVDLEGRYNFGREVYVPELGGAVCVWGGALCTDRPDRPPYALEPKVLVSGGYRPDITRFDEPIYFDRPVDSLASILVFRNMSGDVPGTRKACPG